MEGTFPKLVAVRTLDDAEDPAAAIRGRVDRWIQAAGPRSHAASNFVAGLIPRAVGVRDPDMARALGERDEAMQHRARALAEQAIERNQIWVRRLGTPPSDPATRRSAGSKLSPPSLLTENVGQSATTIDPSVPTARSERSKGLATAGVPRSPSRWRSVCQAMTASVKVRSRPPNSQGLAISSRSASTCEARVIHEW